MSVHCAISLQISVCTIHCREYQSCQHFFYVLCPINENICMPFSYQPNHRRHQLTPRRRTTSTASLSTFTTTPPTIATGWVVVQRIRDTSSDPEVFYPPRPLLLLVVVWRQVMVSTAVVVVDVYLGTKCELYDTVSYSLCIYYVM